MKREILFRVWDIVEKCYLPEDVYCILNRTEFGAFGQMIKDWRDYKEGEWFYDDSQILEQFTGLTDKNGSKIFEGDILGEYHEYDKSWSYRVVAFGKSEDCRWGYFIDGLSYVCTPETFERMKICGNIHDNPELLN